MNKKCVLVFFSLVVFCFSASLVNIKAQNNKPNIIDAAKQNNLQLAKNSIKSGTDINMADENGATALMWACYKADLELVKYLFSKKADPKINGAIFLDEGQTSYYGSLLAIAAAENNLELLKYLIKKRKLDIDQKEYNIESKKNDGWTALQWAAYKGHLPIVEYLVAQGANMSLVYKGDKSSALHYAITNRKFRVAKYLVENGANVNLQDASGRSVLHYAAQMEQVDLLKSVLSQKPNLDLLENNGYSALMLATYYNCFKSCYYLVKAGANNDISLSNGMKAADFAQQNLNNELHSFLTGDKDFSIGEIDKLQSTGNVERGLGLYSQGKYTMAAQEFEKCLPNIARQYGNKDTSYYAKIVLYAALSNHADSSMEKAIGFYKEGIDIFKAKNNYKNNNWYLLFVNNLAGIYEKYDNYSMAEPLYVETLEVNKQIYGENHVNYASVCYNLAKLYDNNNAFQKTIPLLEKAKNIYESQLGKNSNESANCLSSLALCYYKNKDYEKAEPLLIKDRELAAANQGKQNLNYAICCINLASNYQARGNYKKAEALYLEGMGLEQELLGEKSDDFAHTSSKLGSLHYANEKYEKALPFFKQALLIYTQNHGKKSKEYATACGNMAASYQATRSFNNAENYYNEAIKIQEKILGKNNSYFLTNCINLGALYHEMVKYDKAEHWFYYVKDLEEQTQNKTSHEYIVALSHLADLYKDMGLYQLSEKYSIQARNILANLNSDDKTEYILSCNNLAELYRQMGNYKQAEALLIEAKDLQTKHFGKKQENYAVICNNLALLYTAIGDDQKAEKLFYEALEINKDLYGAESIRYSVNCNNLGLLYYESGFYDKAVDLFLHALNVREKTVGKNNPMYATSCNNIALAYSYVSNYKKAVEYYLEAKRIYQSSFGKNHRDYAIACANLAFTFGEMMNEEKSDTARLDLFKKGKALHSEALEIRKQLFGTNNPEYAESMANFAELYIRTGQLAKNDSVKQAHFAKAEKLYIQANEVINSLLDESGRYMSEQERKNYIQTRIVPYYETFNSFFLAQQKSNKFSGLIYNNALKIKGQLMRSSIAIRKSILQSGDTSAINTFNKMQAYAKILAQQYSLTKDKQRIDIQEIEDKINRLEKELALKSQDFAKQLNLNKIDWKDVQKSLRQNEAAIEFIQFNNRQVDSYEEKVFYYGLVLRKGYKYPKAVYLFEQEELQKLIARKPNESDWDYVHNLYSPSSKTSKKLYDLIFKPLEKHVQNSKTVYLSPAGLLNRIAFDAIPFDSLNILSDKYNLYYTSSTSKLPNKTQLYQKGIDRAVLFGGIQYDMSFERMEKFASQSITNGGSGSSANFDGIDSTTRSVSWSYLPGSLEEAEGIQHILEKKNVEVTLYKEQMGNEWEFKKLENNAPSILHISTHGFYFGHDKKSQEYKKLMNKDVKFAYSPNPLLRSGFLLAGANAAFQGENLPDGVEDGVLTAAEISNLNFHKTKLAVLSACQTGLGEVEGSEGVYGLQRSFKMAGVEYLLFSLWEVPDYQTTELMTHFYKFWFSGLEVREAFKKAQEQLKKDYAGTSYGAYAWAAFVLTN